MRRNRNRNSTQRRRRRPVRVPAGLIQMSNGVTLDFIGTPNASTTHYALLVDDAEFDASFARIRKAGIPYYAHPNKSEPGEINHLYGGRGIYFEDPDGHMLELITRPYGDHPG